MLKTILKFIFVLSCIAVCFWGYSGDVYGQPSPALSPWLSLFNNNRSGVLDNYNEFVKPKQDILRSMQNQGNQLRLQESRQQTMQGAMNQLLNDGSTSRVLAEPRQTKSIGGMNGAGFRQYLHYYQGGVQHGGVPNFSQPGRRR
ncbi:MAG: hypothetical protein LBE12_16480 [Planctomycetaceae bacterium]|jgi:hypothetical protein|nr:hypothetical protein [Planctomycetaceae bacterium]